MKFFQTTVVVLSTIFLLGTAQEGKAIAIQSIAPSTQQDHLILARHGGGGYGHGGHHGHHGHWGGGHGWGWGGGVGVGIGIGAPLLYYNSPAYRTCSYDVFGQLVCYNTIY